MKRRAQRLPKAAIASLLVVAAGAGAFAITSGRPAHGDRPAGTPIVMIVFDEFPVTSLMDERHGIDPGRYPNFAAFARRATWFRNATTVHDSTSRAVPAMLDGRFPDEDRMPLYVHHRKSLFTLLAPRYRIHSQEEATGVCPPRLCPNLARRLTRYRRDTPCKVRLVAPGRRPCLGVLRRLNAGRVSRFDIFLKGIEEAGSRPSFNFAHVMFPHAPWQYLPSGHRYRRTAKEPIPGLASEVSLPTPWLAQQAQQRHLLQVGYVDALLGRLIRRLRDTGMYDRSLVVVVADHGLSFRQREDRRAVTPANVQDIAPVPLFVKEPGQDDGSVSGAWVRTIDVFPTVLRAAGLKAPRGIPARALTGLGPYDRHGVRMTMRRDGAQGTVGEILRMSPAQFTRRRDRVLAEKLRLFGSHAAAGLYRIGPHRELVGRRVRDVPRVAPNGVGATVQETAELASVAPRSGFVPSDITGKILRGGPPETQRDIAIAVNGRIRGAGRTFNVKLTPGERYSVMIPESALPAGRDRVEVFEVIREGGVKKLRRLARVY